MAITSFKDSADSTRRYFRITRTWGGVEHQRYVRIRRSEQAALRKAQAIDRELAQRQRAYRLRQELPEVKMIGRQGKIRGLARVTNSRPGRNPVAEFKLRVRHPDTGDLHFTSISISYHGFDTAFQMAVEQILSWSGWQDRSDLRQQMLACHTYYRSPRPARPETGSPPSQPALQSFESGLRQALASYQSTQQRVSS